MDLKDIKELIRIFDKLEIGELEIEEGETRVYLAKSAPAQTYTQPQIQYPQSQPMALMPGEIATTQTTTPVAEQTETGKTIDSPMIGTYYDAATPGATVFASVGDVIEKGQTLCIIEAMKIMNTIEAEYRCKVVKKLIENGNPVEYGQPIFVVEPQ